MGAVEEQVRAEGAALLCALGILTERERAVVFARFWRDEPVASIAVRLGVSTATVRLVQSQALRRMRPELERFTGP